MCSPFSIQYIVVRDFALKIAVGIHITFSTTSAQRKESMKSLTCFKGGCGGATVGNVMKLANEFRGKSTFGVHFRGYKR